jgi:hypothetical protein
MSKTGLVFAELKLQEAAVKFTYDRRLSNSLEAEEALQKAALTYAWLKGQEAMEEVGRSLKEHMEKLARGEEFKTYSYTKATT